MHLNDSQKLWDFAYKPIWLGRVYLGDHKYINIMLLQWLDVLIPHKILEKYVQTHTQCYRHTKVRLPYTWYRVFTGFRMIWCYSVHLFFFVLKQVPYKSL